MDLNKTLERLIQEARRRPVDDRVPYAFESRVMHAIRQQPRADVTTLWARGLWQAVAPCVVLAALAITTSMKLQVAEGDYAYASPNTELTENVDLGGSVGLELNENSGDSLW
ncbi:MAG TPA: hypothetical protein VMF06_08170 [Candidatus Limnocylindria bacterium]|jgi:hypothetical protein|nr:hypothetical protein [Candidatus Limnocylindria bacterium]